METILESLIRGLAAVKNNISPDVVVLVILIGYGQKTFVPWPLYKKDAHVDGAWKTALISLVAIPIYMNLIHHDGSEQILFSKAFFSFVVGTSLYEIVLRAAAKWWTKNEDIIGDKVQDTIVNKATEAIDTKTTTSTPDGTGKVAYTRTSPAPRN